MSEDGVTPEGTESAGSHFAPSTSLILFSFSFPLLHLPLIPYNINAHMHTHFVCSISGTALKSVAYLRVHTSGLPTSAPVAYPTPPLCPLSPTRMFLALQLHSFIIPLASPCVCLPIRLVCIGTTPHC
ncbi:hypothetical protein TRVL_00369 [Trypanosoma vivax]|nr:hypothetical protein TRVL_00369 [Trypanosoma vivax]